MLNKMKEVFPYILFQSIESVTGLGIPDTWFTRGMTGGWAELKRIDRVPKDKIKMPWRPGQLAWYRRLRNKYNSTTPYFIIFTIKDMWYILDSEKIVMKEYYSMRELSSCYVCETSELSQNKKKFEKMLLKSNFDWDDI